MEPSRHRCPECHRTFGLNVRWIHAGVGPHLYRCPTCETVTKSNRAEWFRRDRDERRNYFMRSVFFAAIVTVFSVTAAVYWSMHFENYRPTNLWIEITAAVVFAAASLYQGGRVFASMQRDARGGIEPQPASFWSLESNVIWNLLTPLIVAFLMLLVRHRF